MGPNDNPDDDLHESDVDDDDGDESDEAAVQGSTLDYEAKSPGVESLIDAADDAADLANDSVDLGGSD